MIICVSPNIIYLFPILILLQSLLHAAEDAVVIDTTGKSVQDVVGEVMDIVKTKV